MAETINEVGDDLSTKARSMGINIHRLECSWCSEEAWPADPAQVAKLVEHCAYEHTAHVSILAVQYHELIAGQDLALRLGAPALTDAEQMWRDRNDGERCSHSSQTVTHVSVCKECEAVVSAR